MRLVHLADYGGPYAGSFVPMLRAVMRVACERGHDVEAVFSEVARGRAWLEDLDRDRVHYRFADVSSRRDLGPLVDEVAGEGPCVLHTHFSTFDFACASRARRRRDTVAFWHLHSPLRHGVVAWTRNAVRFRILSHGVEEIICVAPDFPGAVRRRLAPRRRVTFLPNGIDTARFAPAGEDVRAAARHGLSLDAGVPMLLHFGWDWRRKGGDVFLAAAARVRGAVAVTVGGGEPAARLARELGIEDRVRVVGPTNRVEELYAAADVVVTPSRAEGMPFAMAEALACGCPVVASDIPGQRWIGRQLGACRLTRLDPADVASGVVSLLERDGKLAAEEALAARNWVTGNMDVHVWAGKLMDRYDAALARRR